MQGVGYETLTHEVLIKNGWVNIQRNEYRHKRMSIICFNENGSWIVEHDFPIGSQFNTVGELVDIARCLYKVELKFE